MTHASFQIEPGMIGVLDDYMYVVIAASSYVSAFDETVTYELWADRFERSNMTTSDEVIL